MEHIQYPRLKAVSGKEILGLKHMLENGEIGIYESMAMLGKVVVLCSEETNLMTEWVMKYGAILVSNEDERIQNEDDRRAAWEEMQRVWAGMQETFKNMNDLIQDLKKRVERLEKFGGGGGAGGTGMKSVFRQCYKKSKEKPVRPLGGAYNFETGAFVVPDEWCGNTESLTGEGDIWMSYCTFFEDETNTGWSEPIRMINYDELFGKIDEEMKELYDKMLEDAKTDLDKILADASKTLEDSREKLAQAQTKLDDAKKFLDTLTENWGDSGLTTDDIAKIALFSKWYDKNAMTLTTLGVELEGLKDAITVYGNKIDVYEQTINNVKTEWNAAKATITDYTEKVDVLNGTVGKVQQDLNATDAKATTAATWVDTNKNQVNKAIEDINGMDARIDLIATAANTAKNDASEAKLAVNGLDAKVEASVAKKVGEEIATGKFEVTPEKITAAIANSQGAGAAIVAAINGSTSEIKISADKILLNGEVIAKLLEAQRIVINNGASVFEPDGSGFVANGNIRWDKDGVISVGNNAIQFDQSGNMTSLNLKTLQVQSWNTVSDSDFKKPTFNYVQFNVDGNGKYTMPDGSKKGLNDIFALSGWTYNSSGNYYSHRETDNQGGVTSGRIDTYAFFKYKNVYIAMYSATSTYTPQSPYVGSTTRSIVGRFSTDLTNWQPLNDINGIRSIAIVNDTLIISKGSTSYASASAVRLYRSYNGYTFKEIPIAANYTSNKPDGDSFYYTPMANDTPDTFHAAIYVDTTVRNGKIDVYFQTRNFVYTKIVLSIEDLDIVDYVLNSK